MAGRTISSNPSDKDAGKDGHRGRSVHSGSDHGRTDHVDSRKTTSRTASGSAGPGTRQVRVTAGHPTTGESDAVASPSAPRTARSTDAKPNERRFHLETQKAKPAEERGGESKEAARFSLARVKRAMKHEVRRPRIVQEPETGMSKPGSFVDARRLPSEDVVAKTLQETNGSIGVATRPKVVDFTARQKERRKANVRYIVRNAAIVVGVLVVLGFLAWFLFLSPAFRLEQDRISVEGANEWVSSEQVMDIADQQVGKSLLLVSDGAIERGLRDIPGVSEAKASKQFPNGLTVSIVAQRPAAMLKAKDGTLTAVDSQARILNSVSDQSVEGIPVIEVDDATQAVKGRAIKSAVTILDALPESLRGQVTSVSAATQDSIATTFANGITVTWGDDSDLKLKMAIADKIMNDPKVIGDKKEINVSATSRPIIK